MSRPPRPRDFGAMLPGVNASVIDLERYPVRRLARPMELHRVPLADPDVVLLFLRRGREGWRDVRVAPSRVRFYLCSSNGLRVDARFALPGKGVRADGTYYETVLTMGIGSSGHDPDMGPWLACGWPLSDAARDAGPASVNNGEWCSDISAAPSGNGHALWSFTVNVGAYLADLSEVRVAGTEFRPVGRHGGRDPWHLHVRPAVVCALRRWTEYATTPDGPTWFESIKVPR